MKTTNLLFQFLVFLAIHSSSIAQTEDQQFVFNTKVKDSLKLENEKLKEISRRFVDSMNELILDSIERYPIKSSYYFDEDGIPHLKMRKKIV